MKKTGWAYTATGSATEAQMNMAYGIAVMLLEGDAFIDQFRDDLLTDPDVLALTQKVHVAHDEGFDALGEGRRHHIHVEVELSDGSVIARELDYALGSSSRPLSNEDILVKYEKLVAGREGTGAEVKELVLMLESLGDVEPLQKALAEA
jgi:2-methylcitrate dehydratase PrpD